MSRSLMLFLTAVASLAVAASAFASASSSASLKVNPNAARPNGKIQFSGNAGSCAKGSKLTVLSSALPELTFGVGGLKGHVRKNHTYLVKGYVRGNATTGSYPVSVKCGSTDLGVAGTVQVS